MQQFRETASKAGWWMAAWLLLWLPHCPQAADFGDAPDARYVQPDSPCDGYPSTLASNGARHADTSRLWLGRGVTDEADSKQAGDEDDFLTYQQVTSGTYRGDAWINVLMDNDAQDNYPCGAPYGRWESDADWVVRNLKVPDLKPHEQRAVQVPLPADRCFRITLTTRPLSDYHGRGSFADGETEDWCPPPQTRTPPPSPPSPPPPPITGEPPPPTPPSPPLPPTTGEPPPGGEPGPGGGPSTGGPGPGGAGGGAPHRLPIITGSCRREVELMCGAPAPRYDTRCERCVQKHLAACLIGRCMEPDGRSYIQACIARREAAQAANRIFSCLQDPSRGCPSGGGGKKPSRDALLAQWREQAGKYEQQGRELERLMRALERRRNAALQQCRIEAEEACAGQCTSDDDRYRTPEDDAALRQCNGQQARCQSLMDLWPPPRVRSFSSHWLRAWKASDRVYALALRRALAGYLRERLHPYMIATRQKPVRKERKVIASRQDPPRHGKPRVFRTHCATTEVTPVYLTNWEKAQYWKEYDFDLRIPLPLNLDQAALAPILEAFRRIPVLNKVVELYDDFWEGYQERALEGGDTTKALLDSVKDVLYKKIAGYVEGKVEDAKAEGLKQLDQIKKKLAEQLKNQYLSKKGRKSLEEAQEIIGQARERYEKTMQTIERARRLGELPERVKQEIAKRKKEVEQKLGLCGQKLQAKIAAKVRGDVEGALQRLVGKRGSFSLSGGRIEGSGVTQGCVYRAHVHARMLTRVCEEPSCDIDWRKKVLRDDCGETGGPAEPVVTLIRPPDNISGFNPLDEDAIREQIGGEQGAGGGTSTVAGGGTPAGGGGGTTGPAFRIEGDYSPASCTVVKDTAGITGSVGFPPGMLTFTATGSNSVKLTGALFPLIPGTTMTGSADFNINPAFSDMVSYGVSGIMDVGGDTYLISATGQISTGPKNFLPVGQGGLSYHATLFGDPSKTFEAACDIFKL